MSPWNIELCCDVRPIVLDWLWPRYLPRGKLAVLDGDPEMGKSLLTLDLVARLSRGGPLPDGAALPRPHTSVLLSAEDDAGDTIRPRAEAAGADLSRLMLPTFNGRVPRFPDDIPALEALIVERSVDLVVVDPLMAFLPPNVAANLDQCVRLALTPLANLAARTGCSILFIRHLTKRLGERALLRGQGSMGIMAAVRTALFVAPHPGDSTQRVLALSKNNLGRRRPALGYRVIESPSGQPMIEWTGLVDLTADDLCAGKPDEPVRMLARDRAIDWLRRELAAGPRKTADIYAAAAEAEIPDRTLERAREQLPARSHRTYDYKTGRGEWYWYDLDAAWPKKSPFPRPEELPPLPDLPVY